MEITLKLTVEEVNGILQNAWTTAHISRCLAFSGQDQGAG
jgi:hypothetical protein